MTPNQARERISEIAERIKGDKSKGLLRAGLIIAGILWFYAASKK